MQSEGYKLMVQIESYLLSKSVDLPYINPRYFFIILLTRCIMGQKKTRFGVHSVFGVRFHWLPSRAVNIYIILRIHARRFSFSRISISLVPYPHLHSRNLYTSPFRAFRECAGLGYTVPDLLSIGGGG